jgi:hypothetical protein
MLIASPSAVPIAGLSTTRPFVNASRSTVGGTTAIARAANETRPRRNFSGTSSAKSRAAVRATTRRDGGTSFDVIDVDTSTATMIVASSRGTETVACGRAMPTSIAESPSRSSAGGRWRRLPGARATRFGNRAKLAKRDADAARRRSRHA